MNPPTDWQRWFDAHAAGLLLAARLWTRCQADAEDVVQEAFTRAWPRRAAIQDLPAYLYATTRTVALDMARGQRRTKRREEDVGTDPTQPRWFEPAATLETDERRQLIEAALRDLPTDQREVIVLKIWGGLTFDAIATALGIPPNTAASRYRYALDRLRNLLTLEHQP